MKNLKIGITIPIKDKSESIWSNGIRQNILMFCHLLKNSEENYQVFLLNTYKIDLVGDRPDYLDDIEIFDIDEKMMEMDLIIMMGAQIHNAKIEIFKRDPNKRFIGYKCGNNYVNHIQNVLFKESGQEFFEYENSFDELWYVPQQHQCCQGFFSTLYRTNAFPVPFVWHQKFLYKSVVEVQDFFNKGAFKKGFAYDRTKEKKMIGIMEPNIDIVKYSLIPTMIAEESYRTDIGREKIDGLMISNALKLKENKEFLAILKTFDLMKDGKISAEGRFKTAYFLSQHIDILICHQMLNPLNYLYLDAAYMGYPVLHNGFLCKDLGYYYHDGDTRGASNVLNYILTEHDNNIEEYNLRNDAVLQRYHADNEELVKTYDMLIHGVFNGGNHGLLYNPNTNLFR